MTAPEAFVEKLEREFRGRLRLRWSHERGEWHVEQKVRRAFVDGMRPSKRGWDRTVDAYCRYVDGYVLVMSVRTGDRMPCPRCGHELKVPYMRTHLVTCAYCRMIGQHSHVPALYLPLGDALIDYLRRLDPEHPASERLAEDLDRENEQLAAVMEADAVRSTEAAFEENYNRIVGIPTAHLSGKTQMWVEE